MNTLLRTLPLVILPVVLTMTSVGALAENANYRLRNHQLNSQQVSTDDVETEISFGRDIAARVLGKIPLYLDSGLTRYVNLVGKSLAINSSRPEIEFRFAVLNADYVNAYSAPGGYIFITKGALKEMRDESELAAALSHEIAHITQKHIVNEFKIRATDKSVASGVSRLVGGAQDATRVAFAQAVDQAMKVLFERGFKHEDEIAADQEATLLLAATGYDPTALARYLNRIQASDRSKPATSTNRTHPPSEARLAAIKKLLSDEDLNDVQYAKATSRFKDNVKNKL